MPIFIGIPAAGAASAIAAACTHDYRWASYSAGSSAAMAGSVALFGAAFGGKPHLVEYGGVFQPLSIVVGFG